MGRLNHGFSYRLQIGPEESGRTVLDLLAVRFTHSSREEWARRLASGEVTLDQALAGGEELLARGQVLVWNRPPWEEPEVPLHFDVVFEDPWLLVVAKPSGLPTAPAGGFLEHTLLALVQARDPDLCPMHRLGRGTSGLVVFARTATARSALQAAFRTRAVEKTYLALAQGTLLPQRIDTPIGPVPHPRLGEVFAASATGRPAETVVVRVEPRGDDSLVELRLITGRPHQIRIHLASVGHPLVGDPLYDTRGLSRGDLAALPGDLGYWLHAFRVAFAHPITGSRVEFEAAPPDALAGE